MVAYYAATGITLSGANGLSFSSAAPGATATFGAGAAVVADRYTITAANVNSQTGSTYTLLNSDNGLTVTMNNGSANTLVVPASLITGFGCIIIQLGAGQTTITASGTTLHSRNGLKIAGQYGQAGLINYAADTYSVGGDTTT